MPTDTVDVANAGLLPRGDYEEVLKQIVAEGHCPFCAENLPKVHPNPILWESNEWIVTTNAWPYEGAAYHFLLIPKIHVERIEHLSARARLEFFEQYDCLSSEYGFLGATILWRSGATELTGASVKHLHAQIVVGWSRTEYSAPITGLLGFGLSQEKGPSS